MLSIFLSDLVAQLDSVSCLPFFWKCEVNPKKIIARNVKVKRVRPFVVEQVWVE